MSQVCAGWAQADITPAPGIHMGGYWGRRSGAVAVHDDLSARAVVWRGSPDPGAAGVALLALDLVGLSARRAAAIRRQVAAAVGPQVRLGPERIMVCCTHTHAGPLSLPFRGMGEVDEAYLDRVGLQSAACALQAARSLAPATTRYARVPVQIGINRRQGRSGAVAIGRNPEGPVAPYAHVVVLESAAGRAVLFAHACHPVVLGNANHEISAEFPGQARRAVEDSAAALAIFVNGACGDINPRVTGGTFADMESLGAELGQAVAAAVAGADTLSGCQVRVRRERVELPLIDPPPAARAAVEEAVQQLKAAVRSAGQDEWVRRIPEAHLAWSRELLALARSGRRGLTQPFEVQGILAGGLAFLGMEGEIFVRYQLDLEAGSPPEPPAILCGYANGCIGYVPTADEYPRGGYEVETANTRVYPNALMIAPQSEALVRAAALRVLAESTGP